jgi:hypothetical protein
MVILAVLCVCLIIIVKPGYDDATLKWAFGMTGLIVGSAKHKIGL